MLNLGIFARSRRLIGLCRKLISAGLDARKSTTFRQASRRSVNVNLNRTGTLAEEMGLVRAGFMSKSQS